MNCIPDGLMEKFKSGVSCQDRHHKEGKISSRPLSGMSLFLIFLLGLSLADVVVFAQSETEESDSLEFSVNADLVSRYVWRGQSYSQSPCIQPDLSLSWKNFELGAWGSYDFSGFSELETDLYLSKTIGPVTLAFWDYWCFNDTTMDFFDYDRETSGHLLEAQLLISGDDMIPFNLLGGYFFYGADSTHSLYLELQYLYSKGTTELEAFAGYQASGEFYAETSSFVNIGCTVTKPIRVTETWELPLSVSLIMNPDMKSVYIIAGLTF